MLNRHFLIIRLFLLGICFSFANNAYAVLDIELTNGVTQSIPMAVLTFQGENNLALGQPFSAVIRHDLNLSGQFDARNPSLRGEVGTPEAVAMNYQYWRGQSVDDVLVGRIQPVGFHRYQVMVGLVDLYRGTTAPTKILINEQFNVSDGELRGLAHHISDLVYEKLTGVKGIFSTRLAYVLVTQTSDGKKQYSLQVSDVDGYRPRSILISPQPIMSPSWSPDGKQVAYVSFESKLPEIYISNVTTGQRRKITSFPGINGAPEWSPDGSRLAVALSMKQSNPNIYLIHLGTGQLTQITRDNSINTEPAFSPDGRSLIFTSDRGGRPQIYQVNLGTLETKRVTFNGNYNASASFLPDAKNIVLLHRGDTLFNIAVMDLKNGTVKELTKVGRDESPSAAPNGKVIVYATRVNGKGVLEMVSMDGNVQLRLPDLLGTVQEPAWSPYMS